MDLIEIRLVKDPILPSDGGGPRFFANFGVLSFYFLCCLNTIFSISILPEISSTTRLTILFLRLQEKKLFTILEVLMYLMLKSRSAMKEKVVPTIISTKTAVQGFLSIWLKRKNLSSSTRTK